MPARRKKITSTPLAKSELAPRYFFLNDAEYTLLSRYYENRSIPLNTIAAIHYLYGADVVYFHGGITKPLNKVMKKIEQVIDAGVEPYVRMKFRAPPIQKYANEARIAATYLKDAGHETFWPYQTWATKGNKVRGVIERAVMKQPNSKYYLAWKKNNERFKKQAKQWFMAYVKKNPKERLKFWQKDQDSFTIFIDRNKDTNHPKTMTLSQIKKRRAYCENELKAYAEFLKDGFTKGPSKLFPKTEFEK